MASVRITQAPLSAVVEYTDCQDYIDDVTKLLNSIHNTNYLHFVLDFVVLPVICTFGIIGNVLNLLIMTKKQMTKVMNRMEQSVYLGLIALAVSDLLQCFLFLTFLYRMPEYIRPLSFLQQVHVFFYTHREALCNMFLFSSTWLTVLMAFGRYVGICHPIKARLFVKLRVTGLFICVIFCAGILLSLPYDLQYETWDYNCSVYITNLTQPSDCECIIPVRIMVSQYQFYYHVFWFIIEFITPLCILVFCNIRLILSLKQSYQMQREFRVTRIRDPRLHITPTLIAVVFFFIVFISPTEIVKFLNTKSFKILHDQRTVVTVTNILQSLNAAINFILYCIINVHFRKTVNNLFVCRQDEPSSLQNGSHRTRVISQHRSDTTRTYRISDGASDIETHV